MTVTHPDAVAPAVAGAARLVPLPGGCRGTGVIEALGGPEPVVIGRQIRKICTPVINCRRALHNKYSARNYLLVGMLPGSPISTGLRVVDRLAAPGYGPTRPRPNRIFIDRRFGVK